MTQAREAEPDMVRLALSTLPQPLIRQLVLAVPVAVDFVVMSSGDARFGEIYLIGLGVFVATTLAAFVLSRAGATRLALALPLLDLAAIGLMRLVPEGNGLGLLAVLPAMWLAADLRMRGVLLALVGTLVLITVPSLAYFGTHTSWWSRGLLIPIISTMVALTAAGTAQLWSRQNRELKEKSRQLEEALREATANRVLNDAVVRTADIGLVALDRDGAYRYVNPRQQEFLALAFPEGHTGRAGQTGYVFAPDRVRRLEPEDTPSMRAMNGEEFTDHLMWVGSDPATQKALSVSATAVRGEAGEFDGAVLAYKDVTDLMAALRVKDEFVASVSHELRTPLTSIMGFLDLVLDEEDAVTATARRHLEVVKRNSERLLRLIGDLLLAAQVDQGRIALDLRPTDLAAMLRHAVADHRPAAQAAGITMRVELAGACSMHVDPLRIRQVLDNLMSNAVKYTPPGGTVQVAVRRTGDEVVIEVQDDGIGITAEDIGLLFDRFFRAQEAQLRAIQGIGLGLAISNAIVDAHGGRIEVTSVPDQGSCFRVHLPLGRGLRGHEDDIQGSLARSQGHRV